MKYERLSEIYDRFTDDFNHDDWEQWYWKLISSVKGGIRSILDAGCGTGPLSVRFAQRGIKVTGIDLSEDMLRVASDKARRWGVPVRFACQDMRSLEIPSRVDAVIAANPAQVEQYKAGKTAVLQFFVGQLMKQSRGKANPQTAIKLFQERLK